MPGEGGALRSDDILINVGLPSDAMMMEEEDSSCVELNDGTGLNTKG
jgi:hypothetical protein